uniref:Uncharacterized protein n=1 Tax=Arundo donax TaxID=35708 RepID=A0A0A9G3X9_ARUDO
MHIVPSAQCFMHQHETRINRRELHRFFGKRGKNKKSNKALNSFKVL